MLNYVKVRNPTLTLVLHQLPLYDVREPLDALVVVRGVEQDQEGETLLGQLLGVLEGDLADERGALVRSPDVELVVAVKVPGEGLVVLVRPGLVGPEGHDRLVGRVHLSDDLVVKNFGKQ